MLKLSPSTDTTDETFGFTAVADTLESAASVATLTHPRTRAGTAEYIPSYSAALSSLQPLSSLVAAAATAATANATAKQRRSTAPQGQASPITRVDSAFLHHPSTATGELGARRPSTSVGNSISQTVNVKNELNRSIRSLQHPELEGFPSSPLSYGSHMMSKQVRISEDAGHKSILLTGNEGVNELDKVIAVINDDPDAQLSHEKMVEIKAIRKQIVTMLSHKIVAMSDRKVMKKHPQLATAKAAEEKRVGRALTLKPIEKPEDKQKQKGAAVPATPAVGVSVIGK